MLKPLNDNVILKKEKAKNTTSSGIIISTKEKNEEGLSVVYAVGPGKVVDGKLEKIDLKKGDKVIYKKYSTTDISFKDEDYMIVKYSDILAVVEE